MTSARPHRLGWVPPFLVGASAAVGAEVALALLLYGGPGLVRSLTVVLAVIGVALAGGLWSAPSPAAATVDGLRRRWLLGLFAFLTAAVLGVAWSLPQLPTQGRLEQALGLAFLAALPLFACGSILGAMSSVAPVSLGAARTGAAAALGAGAGFVLTGLLLPRAPLPGTLLLGCLVMLSLGGMIFGAVLEHLVEVRVLDERASAGGVLRVEDRRLASAGISTRVLLEAGHERRQLVLGEEGEAPWDVAVARSLMPAPGRPWRVLAVGGGASHLARAVLREHPEGTVSVLERWGGIVDLARDHFDTGLSVGDGERVRVEVGNLEDLVKAMVARYDLVLVDSAALAPIGGARGLSREARARLVQAVGPSGALVWGPDEPDPGLPELAERWPRVTFTSPPGVGRPRTLVVWSPRALPELPGAVGGFVLRNGDPART